MPKSSMRKKTADAKRSKARGEQAAAKTVVRVGERNWVPYVFVPLALLGGIWLVVYYIAGSKIPFMADLGDWNMLIALGLLATSFITATFWK